MIWKNNKGIGSIELITILGFLIILIAVVLGAFAQTGLKQKYEVFTKNADNMATMLSVFRDNNPKFGEYICLQDGISARALKQIGNPFSGESYCDPYESYVEIIGNLKYVTLKCGSYVIDRHRTGTPYYSIYKVGKWSSEIKGDSLESTKVYNYYSNGKLVFPEYLTLNEFLYEYNKKEGTNIIKFENIGQVNWVSKVVYRTRTLVKQIS